MLKLSHQLLADRLPFALFLGLVATAPFVFFVDVGEAQISLDSLWIWGLLGVGLLQVVLCGGVFRVRRVPLLLVWAGFLFWMLLTFSLGANNLRGPVQAVWALFRNAEIFLIFPIAVQVINSERRIRIALLVFLAAITLTACFGIVQSVSNGRYLSGLSINGNSRYLGLFYSTPFDPQKIGWNSGAPFFRAHGATDSPNFFAAILNLGLVIGVSFFLTRAVSGTRRMLVLGAVLLIIAASLLSQSRGGIIAAVIACTVIVLSLLRPSPATIIRLTSLGSVLVVIGLGAYFVLPESLQTRIDTIRNPTATSEVQSRFEVWEIAIARIQQKPLFGYGNDRIPGGLLTTWGTAPPDVSPHNMFLTIAYVGGVPYLIMLLLIFFWAVIQGSLLTFAGRSPTERAVGASTIGAIIALSAHGMLDSLLQPRNHMIMFWILLGVTAAAVACRTHVRRVSRSAAVSSVVVPHP